MLSFVQYSRTSMIRISRWSGLFLRSQFGHDYLLVTIKIRSHIHFKATALKGAVKCEGHLLAKSKSSARAFRNLTKNIQMSSDWLRVALLLSEIPRSMALKTKKLASRSSAQAIRSFGIKDKNEAADDIVFQMFCKSVVSRLNIVFLI